MISPAWQQQAMQNLKGVIKMGAMGVGELAIKAWANFIFNAGASGFTY